MDTLVSSTLLQTCPLALMALGSSWRDGKDTLSW